MNFDSNGGSSFTEPDRHPKFRLVRGFAPKAVMIRSSNDLAVPAMFLLDRRAFLCPCAGAAAFFVILKEHNAIWTQ